MRRSRSGGWWGSVLLLKTKEKGGGGGEGGEVGWGPAKVPASQCTCGCENHPLQGRKKYTPPPWRPSFFFFLFPGLRLYGVYPSFRTYGVYPFPLFSQENGIHHSFFCSVTLGSGDRPSKEGCDGGGVYSFFSGFSDLPFSPSLMDAGIREEPPWVDSACADCPCFLVLGAAGARLGASDCAPQLAFAV